MKITAATHPGCIHDENQDHYRAGRLADDTYWMVLCDGMGGGSAGGLASELTVGFLSDSIQKYLPDLLAPEDIKVFLQESASRSNELVLEESRRAVTPSAMGTTLVLAVVRGSMAYIVHAGDSRMYLLQRGAIRQLTHDHSYVQELIDNGKLTPDQAFTHPNKNIITSAIGVDISTRIDYNEKKLSKGDMLLACSDGLSNMLKDSDIASILKETDFYSTADVLVQKAVDAGGYDNITAIVLEME